MDDTDKDNDGDRDDADPRINESGRKHAGTGPTPPAAWVIHEIIREDGERELERGINALTWSAVGAGLSMGFSFLTMAVLRSRLPDAPWSKLVAGFGYTIGFLIVVLGRQQLFTESTLTAILPLLTRRDGQTAYRVLRLWGVVLVANLVGTFLFAWLLGHQGLFEPEMSEALKKVAEDAIKDPFWPMLIKGILAGWLIALMVWLIPGAGQGRLLLIVVVTYVVAIAGFSHIVAGSVEVAFDVFDGRISLVDYFGRFMAPTLIGNTIGGVALVAVLNHAPVQEHLPAGERGGAPDDINRQA